MNDLQKLCGDYIATNNMIEELQAQKEALKLKY